MGLCDSSVIPDVLQRAGVLPGPADPPDTSALGGNLIEWLRRGLAELTRSGRHWATRQAARRRLGWLGLGDVAELRVGLPGDAGWIDPRLVLWPHGLPRAPRVAILCSRLGRMPERYDWWFRAVRGYCQALAGEEVLLVAEGTTMARYVRLIAARRGLRRIELTSAPSWRAFGRAVRDTAPASAAYHAVVSPSLQSNAGAGVPVQDRGLAVLGDRLLIGPLRPGGNTERLVVARLVEDFRRGVLLAESPRATERDRVRRLLPLGAVGLRGLSLSAGQTGRRAGAPPASAPVLPIERLEWPSGSYLCHWTRQRDGCWPGETTDQYLDDLLLARPGADHSPLAALRRIVRSGCLRASKVNRASVPVVCFTEVGVADLPRLRRYQSHRQRWDFERYGIGILRTSRAVKGARRVVYGDPNSRPSDDDLPFFQPARSQTSRGGSIDWTCEREWRILGNVDLTSLSSAEAFAFVPSESEARELSFESRWPIYFFEGD